MQQAPKLTRHRSTNSNENNNTVQETSAPVAVTSYQSKFDDLDQFQETPATATPQIRAPALYPEFVHVFPQECMTNETIPEQPTEE